jgi:hypothetical protein
MKIKILPSDRVENDTALVYAVLDCRRNPAWIRKRLRNKKLD